MQSVANPAPTGRKTAGVKLEALSEPFVEAALRPDIADAMARLDAVRVRDLTRLLERVGH